MKKGNRDAQSYFPRLLELLENEVHRTTFKALAAQVPAWMYLKWIPQMAALLDKAEGEAVLDILAAIAVSYPRALRYPLRISADQYNFSAKQVERSFQTLYASVRSDLDDRFVTELSFLTNTEHVLKDWMAALAVRSVLGERLRPH